MLASRQAEHEQYYANDAADPSAVAYAKEDERHYPPIGKGWMHINEELNGGTGSSYKGQDIRREASSQCEP